MAMTVETLPDDPEALKKIIFSQTQLLAEQSKKINFLMEQFRLARQKRFGASTEVAPGQAPLFNEAEQTLSSADSERDSESEQTLNHETKAVSAHTRKKPTRSSLPKDLPRETVIVDLSEEEKVCPCCQGELHKIGQESREQLEFIPAQMKVIETIRPKYACRACEKNNVHTPIKIAPPPASPIPKGIATASLLAQVIINKYQYALPLYRQESIFKDYGIELSRKTMADWVIKSSELLEKLVHRLKHHQLLQSVIHADESPVKVIESDKQKCYMWVYCTGTDSPDINNTHKNIVIYDYHASRSGQCPQNYLKGYEGYLQVDAYAGYESTQAVLVGCLAHARRKFVDAKNAQPKGKTGKADWAINHIQKLYRLEKHIQTLSAEEKYQARQEHAIPLLNQFKEWLDKSLLTVAPKTTLGTALGYCAKQWEKLIRYTQDGNLSIDNNRAERALKPFVIGRKNWMFSNTNRGAAASAVLYSLIETAKANGLEPLLYLNKLFEELPKREAHESVEDLMPWVIKI